VSDLCPACAEDLPSPEAQRCPTCGERLGERESRPSPGYDADTLVIATLCTLGAIAALAVFG
jgi:predicted amidophosphoribosyltransferase